MSKYPERQDREELRELLQQYDNLKAGRSHSFIEENSFEKIIDLVDDSCKEIRSVSHNMMPNALLKKKPFIRHQGFYR